MNISTEAEVIIIGAGIAGMLAACELKRAGIDPIIIDKGRQVGGRMATRRIGEAVFDHGAQYFTAKDTRFRRYVDAWMEQGIVREWPNPAPEEEHPRYVCPQGMTAICKHIAEEIPVRKAERVVSITRDSSGYTLTTDASAMLRSREVILTAPVPQTIDLLGDLFTDLSTEEQDRLNLIQYDPCLALLVPLDSAACIPEPGRVTVESSPVAFIAESNRKGISPNAFGLTVHAAEDFSRKHYTDDDATIVSALLPEVQAYLPSGASLDTLRESCVVKRWKFAKPQSVYPKPFASFDELPGIYIAGDAFHSPRVEGAALSGIEVAAGVLNARASSL